MCAVRIFACGLVFLRVSMCVCGACGAAVAVRCFVGMVVVCVGSHDTWFCVCVQAGSYKRSVVTM